jgi:hypothetical protein
LYCVNFFFPVIWGRARAAASSTRLLELEAVAAMQLRWGGEETHSRRWQRCTSPLAVHVPPVPVPSERAGRVRVPAASKRDTFCFSCVCVTKCHYLHLFLLHISVWRLSVTLYNILSPWSIIVTNTENGWSEPERC